MRLVLCFIVVVMWISVAANVTAQTKPSRYIYSLVKIGEAGERYGIVASLESNGRDCTLRITRGKQTVLTQSDPDCAFTGPTKVLILSRNHAIIGVQYETIDDQDGGVVAWLIPPQGKPRQVGKTGTSTEAVDIDGDGVAELVESSWPDGDGYPKSSVIYAWNGIGYRRLMEVNWSDRFSSRVANALRGRIRPAPHGRPGRPGNASNE